MILLGGGVLFLVLVARLHTGSGADLLDWPSREPEERLAREQEDLRELLLEQNRRRRSRGQPEISEEEVQLRGTDALDL